MTAAATNAASWESLFVFGDSYSDSGAGYVDGNGPTAVVYMARELGIPFTQAQDPERAGKGKTVGLNFAVSGGQTGEGEGTTVAGTVYDTGEQLLGRGMLTQVADFVSRVEAGEVVFDPEKTLFFIAGGLNDRPLKTEETVSNLTRLIEALVAVGARHVLVSMLPVEIPPFRDVAVRLNPALEAIPDSIKLEGLHIGTSRWGQYFDEVMRGHEWYGFTNTTDACAGRRIFDQDPTPVGDPDTYYYYHEGHPSTAVHRIVGHKLAEEVKTFWYQPEVMELWESGVAPVDGVTVETPEVEPLLSVYHPKNPNGTAIVICPGGGYRMRVSGGEGHGIAQWLDAHGITGVVLDYRLPEGRCEVPLLDAQQALRITRANAEAWGIDPARIGIMGFSAGGHVAATATTSEAVEFEVPMLGDGMMEVSCRPDFAILIYPVISMQNELTHEGSRTNLLGETPSQVLMDRFSNELQVNGETPPVFLAHAVDDSKVPVENSRVFAQAMKANGRPVTLLELPDGDHGLNGYKGPSWDRWQKESLEWLETVTLHD